MTVNAKEFIKRKEHDLAKKYAKRSLRRLIHRNASTTQEQLDQIDNAYRQFIDLPLEAGQT